MPGRIYRTTAFHPALTYTVASVGWSNLEDLNGNFLLVPPRNNLAGVNAGTSDYIGIYTSIAPGAFDHPPSCSAPPVKGLPDSPAAIAAWFARQPLLSVTGPLPATVGGLQGVSVDLKLRPGVRVPTCIDDMTGNRVQVYPLIIGQPPSDLEHGLVPGLTLRLYLLRYGQGVLGVEVDDVARAPGTLSSLSAELARLHFAS